MFFGVCFLHHIWTPGLQPEGFEMSLWGMLMCGWVLKDDEFLHQFKCHILFEFGIFFWGDIVLETAQRSGSYAVSFAC